MPQTTFNIHVRVMALHPPTGTPRPVPGATVQCKDYGWLCDTELSPFSAPSESDGHAQLTLTFDDASEAKLNPFFVIQVPEGARDFPGAEPPARRLSLPAVWRTQHDEGHRIPKIRELTDPGKPLEIFVGLGAKLRVGCADFAADGLHNPMALPEDTTRVLLADYDEFLWIDCLNPDDTLTGTGYEPRQDKVIPAGEKDRYRYFDVWPTEPCAFLADPGPPRACLDPPGAPVGTLGGGSFDAAGPLAVDAHGFVFMIDGNVVRRFYADGTLCETIAGSGPALNAPRGLTLDQHRYLYVADTGNDRVRVFEPRLGEGGTGTYVELSAPFSAVPALNGPVALAVVPERVVDADELLAVVDAGNHEVKLFRIRHTATGAAAPSLSPSFRAGRVPALSLDAVSSFGAPGNGAGQFQTASGIAADLDKRLYVCDSGAHRVSVWRPDASGTAYVHDSDWEKVGGGSGNGAREFNAPSSIAVDRKNRWAYVQEDGNQRIQRIELATGNALLSWAPAPGGAFVPSFVASDPRSELYVSDVVNARVLRATSFTAGGVALSDNATPLQVGAPWSPASALPHMKSPGYVTFGADGRLWVADTGNGRVLHFTRDPSGVLTPGTPPAVSGLTQPVGIALSSDGHVFIVESGNDRVRHYDATLTHVADFGSSGAGAAQLAGPRGIACAPGAAPLLYVADRDNHRIQIAQPDGSFVGAWTHHGTSALKSPEDVAVAANGNVFVADTGNRRVLEFKPDGSAAGVISVTGGALAWREPCGVALQDDGSVLVTDRKNNAVYHVDGRGTVLGVWDLESLNRKQVQNGTQVERNYYPELRRLLVFDAPARAVLDARGLLAVADSGQHRVRLVRVCTNIDVHLTDLGESLPDISFRAITDADWREDLGFRVEAGGDDDHDFITDPSDSFALDQYHTSQRLREAKNTNGATNTLRVLRLAQRWLTRMSREDEASGRWGVLPAFDEKLFVNVTREQGTFRPYGKDHLQLGTDSTGKGSDAWEDAVIVHEWTHWVFEKVARPRPPFELIYASHGLADVHAESTVTKEGFSGYLQLGWGSEYGEADRVRGYALLGGSALTQIRTRDAAGNISGNFYLFGGATSAAPTFDTPGRGTEVEGYFANCCYQIHRALSDPGIQFCDAPSYWYPFNAAATNEQSRRWSAVIWKALRLFPENPTEQQFKQGARQYLLQVLAQAHLLGPRFGAVVQALLELNNMLMPEIALSEGTSAVAPGAASSSPVSMALGAKKDLIAQIKDAGGRPLAGYTLTLKVSGSGVLSKASAVSNANGIVNFEYTAPAAAASDTLTVSYQPDFDSHAELASPEKGDDLDTTLRRLYLYELRAANKIWSGSNDNRGAIVQGAVTIDAA